MFQGFQCKNKNLELIYNLFSGPHNYSNTVSSLLVHFKFQLLASMDNVYKISCVSLNEIID